MARVHYFLGIDGGGSRTTAWLAAENGRVVGRGSAGPSNPLKAGFAAAELAITHASAEALRRARLTSRKLDGVCAGLAGANRPAVRSRVLRWLRKSVSARCYHVTSDAMIALDAALGENPGVVVISGTGSIAYGRDVRGEVLRSGGWGIPFDDNGSGYDLGRKAVAAALRAFDGRGPRTRLEKLLCGRLRLRQIVEIVERPLAQHEIASLFPLVLRAAESGDAVARALCDEAAEDLAKLATPLLNRLRPVRSHVRVVCAGGVFRASPRIRRRFSRLLRANAPRAEVVLMPREPVEGAISLARRLCTGKVVPEREAGGSRRADLAADRDEGIRPEWNLL